MKGNEFLEKMELIDPVYIEAADVKPEKRKNEWIKWVGAAACLCLVAMSAFAMPWGRGVNDISYIEPSIADTAGEAAGEKILPENEIGGSSVNSVNGVMTVPDTAPVTEPAAEPSYNSGVHYAPNNMEAIDAKPMISSYGEISYEPDMTVADGEVHFSKSLLSAMANHGDNVNYRVLIEFFRDGRHVWSGGQTALDEMNRLSDLGYIVAFETYAETKEHGEYVEANATHYFTIHATYEQLQNFAANDALGYSVMLYDEYFGRVQPLDAPVVYHGFHGIGE